MKYIFVLKTKLFNQSLLFHEKETLVFKVIPQFRIPQTVNLIQHQICHVYLFKFLHGVLENEKLSKERTLQHTDQGANIVILAVVSAVPQHGLYMVQTLRRMVTVCNKHIMHTEKHKVLKLLTLLIFLVLLWTWESPLFFRDIQMQCWGKTANKRAWLYSNVCLVYILVELFFWHIHY